MADHYFSQADIWLMEQKKHHHHGQKQDRNIFSVLDVIAEMLHPPVFSHHLEMTNHICQQLILPCLLAFWDFCTLLFS